MIDLILKDVESEVSQENFFRLKSFIDAQVLFDGNFKLFEVDVPGKEKKFKVSHGLSFIPYDIISLSAFGDLNFYFRHQEFDREFIYITTNGPVRLKFLAGNLKKSGAAQGIFTKFPYGFVGVGDVIRPASPGFVFGAVGDKEPGAWLTSEGVPSNVCGVPVLFGDGIIAQAAVGTEVESSYRIGIYEHAGNQIDLTKIGEFSVAVNGPKRIELNIPIQYVSNNTQIACRLEAGSTRNLKVSLSIRGLST